VFSNLLGMVACRLTFTSTLQASKSPRSISGPVRWRGSACCVMSLRVSSAHLRGHTQRGSPRFCTMQRLVCAHFLWPGMRMNILSWCRDCVSCQCATVTKQPWASLQPIPIPQRKFSLVHLEPIGPSPVSKDSFVYLMTDRLGDLQGHFEKAIPRSPPCMKNSDME
jgi:hypothetical protein